jgi:hypothetical protein
MILAMNQVTNVIDQQIEAYRKRDIDSFLSFYVPDVQICDIDGAVRMDGTTVMRQRYGELFENSPELAAEIANRITVGEFVIDEEHITGFNLPGYPTELHSAVVYRVQNGKINRVLLLG